MKARTLHLVLKRQWWDMIESLEKPEEYRDITMQYCSRLILKGDWIYLRQYFENDSKRVLQAITASDNVRTELGIRWRDYDEVCFHRGYTNATMSFEFKGISIGYGNPDWGAPTDREVFKIKLGKRI